MSLPLVNLGALPETDGSASYSWQGFEVLGAVNGPIEPQRRDELPEEAFLEVHIRPASGVGGKTCGYSSTRVSCLTCS